MDLSVVPYNKQSHNNINKADNESEDGDIVEPRLSADKTNHNYNNYNLNSSSNKLAIQCNDVVKYRECMRNHAASLGGHANDGCGEFMPSSAAAAAENNDASALACAACGCHRNFHRRELVGGGGDRDHQPQQHPHYPVILYNAAAAGPSTPRWDHHHHHHAAVPRRHHGHAEIAMMTARESAYERRSSETPEREDVATAVTTAGSGGGSGKRFRTKFTQDQKERMLAFAESIGWRIQRQDDVAINQFCSDIGVKRNVLKVWMHNNKNAHRRREPDAPPAPPSPPPPPPMSTHATPPPNPQPVGV